MKQLGYISRYDLNDSKAWSGTIHNLKTILEQEYEIIPVIVPTTVAHKAAGKFTKLISGKKNGASDFARPVDKNSLQKQMRDAIGGGARCSLLQQQVSSFPAAVCRMTAN